MIAKNRRGNSLIGIIIVAGLMVSILYGVMDLLNYGQKNHVGFISSMDFQQTHLTAMMVLTNPKLCESNFKDKIINPADPTNSVPTFSMISINGEVLIPDGNARDLKNVKIKVQNAVNSGTPTADLTLYKADITIEAEQAKPGIGSPFYLDSFPIQFLVDKDNKIISCYSTQAKACTTDPTNNPPQSGPPKVIDWIYMGEFPPDKPGTITQTGTGLNWDTPAPDWYETVTMNRGISTKFLNIHNPGPVFPAGAVLTGIEFYFLGDRQNYDGDIRLSSLRLIVDGVVAGENKAPAGVSNSFDSQLFFGSGSDLWGITNLTATQASSANFGVQLQSSRPASDANSAPDHPRLIRIGFRFHYTEIN